MILNGIPGSRSDKSKPMERGRNMSKKCLVLLVVMALSLVASSVLLACPQPIPEFALQYHLYEDVLYTFDVIRPGVPNDILYINCELDWDGNSTLYTDSVTWTWNWGDGTGNSTGATGITHTYANVGYYTITITCSDSNAWSLEDDVDVVKRFYVKVD
jgi:hypothetical protein